MEVEAAQPRRRPSHLRLVFWTVFVGLIAAVNYYGRFSGGNNVSRGNSRDELYSWTTFAGGTILYAIWLGIILLICVDRFDLLALRRPRRWGQALWLGLAAVVGIYVLEAIVSALPLPESPGKEQGITNVQWEPSHADRKSVV